MSFFALEKEFMSYILFTKEFIWLVYLLCAFWSIGQKLNWMKYNFKLYLFAREFVWRRGEMRLFSHSICVFNSGSRARSAMFGLLYKKILKLRSLKSKAVGEVRIKITRTSVEYVVFEFNANKPIGSSQ